MTGFWLVFALLIVGACLACILLGLFAAVWHFSAKIDEWKWNRAERRGEVQDPLHWINDR